MIMVLEVKEVLCPLCKGKGYSNGKNKCDCSECLGSGMIVKLVRPERNVKND